MDISRFFILRPVATVLFMVAILLSGAIAYGLLPVAALPQVDYPTIQVMTFYPGAGADVMTSSVTAPETSPFACAHKKTVSKWISAPPRGLDGMILARMPAAFNA